jgi:glycerate 2-kinase
VTPGAPSAHPTLACVGAARRYLLIGADQAAPSVGADDESLMQIRRILLVGAGKAAVGMAVGVQEALAEGGVGLAAGSVVLTKHGHRGGGGSLRGVKILEGGHPQPDAAGAAGAAELLAAVQSAAHPETLVVCCLSGGASSLLSLPAPGLTMEDLAAVNAALLTSGATIDQVNVVRKKLSAATGGRLAAAAYPSPVLSLILSDVVGDTLSVIASGPTCADPSTFEDALQVLRSRGLAVPPRVRAHLEAGAGEGAGPVPGGRRPAETPKQTAPCFRLVSNVIVGSNALSLAAAQAAAERLGYVTRILSSRLQGEAAAVGAALADLALSRTPAAAAAAASVLGLDAAAAWPPFEPGLCAPKKWCYLLGGETTVTVVNAEGRGGRNQECALACALAMHRQPEARRRRAVAVMCGGTDGQDASTPAAGAIVTASLLASPAAGAVGGAKAAAEALLSNNSHSFFASLDAGAEALIITGPTGTNVADVTAVLVEDLGDEDDRGEEEK